MSGKLEKNISFHLVQPEDGNDQHASSIPLIILHGFLGSKSNWRSIQNKLVKQGFMSYALDCRNHGQSFHDDEHHYDAMVDDVIEFMDKHHIQKAIILGRSMGGKTAMLMALTHPERVEKLVVVDIAPVKYNHHYDKVFHALQSIELDKNPTRLQVQAQLQATLQDANMAGFLAQNYIAAQQAAKTDAANWRMNLPALINHIKNIMDFPLSGENYPPHKRYDQPVLLIYGQNSNYIDWNNNDSNFYKYPIDFNHFFCYTTSRMVEDSGHMPHFERPEVFMKYLMEFI